MVAWTIRVHNFDWIDGVVSKPAWQTLEDGFSICVTSLEAYAMRFDVKGVDVRVVAQ